MGSTPIPRMMSIAKVAAQIDCHPETLRRAIRAGKLACYKLGRCTRITQEQLQAYLDAALCPAVDQTDPAADEGVRSFLDEFRWQRRMEAALDKSSLRDSPPSRATK
jgi:excisionase family DNA binding protein